VRLIVGAGLVAVLVLVGVALFIVPGIVILFLLGIVGPLIAIERLGIWSALRRSATLAWRHPLLVTFTVTIPLLLEDVPVRLLERITWLEALPASVMLDVLSSIFLGGLVGVLEVTLARALLAEDRRRRAPDEREPAAGRRGRTGTKAIG
jgi:hypothetical protein